MSGTGPGNLPGKRPVVVLFDIDGTLLDNGGSGRRSMHDAFGGLYGRRDATKTFSFAGRTDRAIMRKGLESIGIDPTEERIDELIETYLDGLRRYLPEATQYRVMPGAHELVGALRGLDEVAVGLGTGNVREGARMKLEHGGLWSCFDFGGYGDDAEERVELLTVGARRGAELLGRGREECDVVVIGDTELDVRAAHSASARCLGVATGPASVSVLEACGAERAAADLSEAGLLEWITGS
jgi:phosphoglycolate phosphatase